MSEMRISFNLPAYVTSFLEALSPGKIRLKGFHAIVFEKWIKMGQKVTNSVNHAKMC